MGTKSKPGKFDCYHKAAHDEPLFVLLARDEHAPEVVRYWACLKRGFQPVGWASMVTPETRVALPEKLREALDCADAMEAWKVNDDLPF